jgi:TatD DNase family protein
MLADTHTHVYLPDFSADLGEVINRAKQQGISKMYLPNIDDTSIDALHSLAESYPEVCFPMMGIHPCSIKPDTWSHLLETAYHFLKRGNYAAVGEIGLDLYWDKSTADIQTEALKIQCEWALEFGLPVSLHSRAATAECIEVIKPYAAKGLSGVFHCFSGSAEEARLITEMGFYLGIGGVVTFKTSHLPEILKPIDPLWLVLETDAPYLAPVPFRGKRNEPSYLKIICDRIAEIYQTGATEIAALTTDNAKKLFKHGA